MWPRWNDPLDPGRDAQHMPGEPVMELHPAQHDGKGRAAPEQCRSEADENPHERRRIEYRRERERPQERHQMSAHTASRRRTYLLYSPNKVRKLGSDRTASVSSR